MPSRLQTRIVLAYNMIGSLTPLPSDCGRICGAACCNGDDDAGMLLFPGEKELVSHISGFEVVPMKYMDTKALLLLCPGICDRDTRPLSCRIFPLAPLVRADGSVIARPDPRARQMCPLADGKCLDKRFKVAVGTVFSLLAGEPRILSFMQAVSDELDGIQPPRRIQ